MKRLVQVLLTPLPSCLKVPLYRLLGARIHRTARIAAFSVLVADEIELGPHAQIKPLTVILGPERVSMGAYSGISNLCVIHGGSALSLGPRSYIAAGCMVDLHAPIRLGEYSALGPRCVAMTHAIFWPPTWGLPHRIAPISIGDLVWVASNCTISAGVEIGSRCFIMANSAVSKSVPEGGMIYDVGPRRTAFPFHLMQKAVTESALRRQILDMAESYHKDRLQGRGYTLTTEGDRYILGNGRQTITIRFFDRPTRPGRRANEWWFGYDYEDELLAAPSGPAVLDFRRLLHSPSATSGMRDAVRYFKSTWGLWFADARYRDRFSLQPPELNRDGREQEDS